MVRDMKIESERGASRPVELVPQQLTRWYGFSATFPGCGIYEG